MESTTNLDSKCGYYVSVNWSFCGATRTLVETSRRESTQVVTYVQIPRLDVVRRLFPASFEVYSCSGFHTV
jgi:hypothetical protein